MSHRPRLVLIAALALFTLSGCSVTDSGETKMNERDMIAVKNALAAKGTVEEEIARLDPLMREMADMVVEVVPGLTWRVVGKPAYLGCKAVPGDSTSASSQGLPNIVFDGPIPDDVWPQALSRVQHIAAGVGATEPVVRADGPGSHDVLLVGGDHVEFGLGSGKAAVISAKTGCHLNLDEVGEYPK